MTELMVVFDEQWLVRDVYQSFINFGWSLKSALDDFYAIMTHEDNRWIDKGGELEKQLLTLMKDFTEWKERVSNLLDNSLFHLRFNHIEKTEQEPFMTTRLVRIANNLDVQGIDLSARLKLIIQEWKIQAGPPGSPTQNARTTSYCNIL